MFFFLFLHSFGGALLCCGISSRIFATRSLAEWHGELAKCQLIVPSPMSARHGYTQSGKRSAHTLQNTGPRKYLVVEFYEGTHDDHASLLSYLNTNMTPLVCAVMSGNKSLHGWFRVEDWNERNEEVRKRSNEKSSLKDLVGLIGCDSFVGPWWVFVCVEEVVIGENQTKTNGQTCKNDL